MFVFLLFAYLLFILPFPWTAGHLQRFWRFHLRQSYFCTDICRAGWWGGVTEANGGRWSGQTRRRRGERMKDGRIILLSWPACLQLNEQNVFRGLIHSRAVSLCQRLPCRWDSGGDGGGSKYHRSCQGAVWQLPLTGFNVEARDSQTVEFSCGGRSNWELVQILDERYPTYTGFFLQTCTARNDSFPLIIF